MVAETRIAVWEYARNDEDALAAADAVARDRLRAPDLEVLLVSARAGHLTVQVVRGQLRDPAAILYVGGSGTFEVVRIEPWPGARLLLVLRAWGEAVKA